MDLQVQGDTYQFDLGAGIVIEVERLTEDSGGLTGEITIADHSGLGTRLLHSARLNLMSTQSRNGLVKSLEKAKPDYPWYKTLEEVCFLAKDRFRQGDPILELGQLPPCPTPRWLLHPFAEHGGPTVLFGDGGTGKSFLALAIAASIAGGYNILGTLKVQPVPVLYLDWETNEYTHDQRVAAICRAVDRPVPRGIFYRRQVTSLASSVDNLRREIVRLKVGFVIIDSLGAALGGEPEKASETLAVFTAARSLGVAWLGLAHITKGNASNGDAKKPFGSVFGHNMARMTWGAEAAQEEGDDFKGITMTNHKANNGRLQKPFTVRLQFHNDDSDELQAVDIQRCDVTEFPTLAAKLPLRQRILSALRGGLRTYEELTEETGAPYEQLKGRMAELVRSGAVVKIPLGKSASFGLSAGREASPF